MNICYFESTAGLQTTAEPFGITEHSVKPEYIFLNKNQLLNPSAPLRACQSELVSESHRGVSRLCSTTIHSDMINCCLFPLLLFALPKSSAKKKSSLPPRNFFHSSHNSKSCGKTPAKNWRCRYLLDFLFLSGYSNGGRVQFLEY